MQELLTQTPRRRKVLKAPLGKKTPFSQPRLQKLISEIFLQGDLTGDLAGVLRDLSGPTKQRHERINAFRVSNDF